MCQGKPVQDIDHDFLGKKTENFSGADLKALIDLAIEKKLTEAMKDGIPRPLTTKDLQNASASVKPSTREWFASATILPNRNFVRRSQPIPIIPAATVCSRTAFVNANSWLSCAARYSRQKSSAVCLYHPHLDVCEAFH
jgi:hypothetical protein